MAEKIKLGISSCLLGEETRYDGKAKTDYSIIKNFSKYVEWVPVCPEIESGLSVPREKITLKEKRNAAVYAEGLETQKDFTELIKEYTTQKLKSLKEENLYGFIFKSKSPSCGLYDTPIALRNGVTKRNNAGLFASSFTEYFPFIPIIDEKNFHIPEEQENFFERVFLWRRWDEYINRSNTNGKFLDSLFEFHKNHKFQIMSHSPKIQKELGQLLSNTKNKNSNELLIEYKNFLNKSLKYKATRGKNVNTLEHILGFLKNFLSKEEKQSLFKTIKDYREGYLPLISPVVLLRHYNEKYGSEYIKNQHYLYPDNSELFLRYKL